MDSHIDPMDYKVTELLKEAQINYSSTFTKLVSDTVSAIQQSIHNIPHDLAVTGDEAAQFVKDVGADKVGFKFKKPQFIQIGGSYSIKCIVKPHLCVDVFVRLPKECFYEKDYLNHRYHAKRFLYLCVIKKYLESCPFFKKVNWSSFQNEARKPVLNVHPAKKLAEFPGFYVRIIPTAKSLFDVSKLCLKRNNIRSLSQDGSTLSTPRYNSSILEDMLLEDNAEFLKEMFLGWKELREALILLKVWALQRSSIYVHDCLNGFLIACILAHLATHECVNKHMKPLQIFRITMGFIAKSKLSQVFFIRKNHDTKISMEERLLNKETFPVVIFDSSAHSNLAFRITNNGLVELQEEASLTLKCLEKSEDGGFEDTFITRVDFPAKYDYCVRLNLKGNTEVYPSGFCLDDECWRLYEQKVHSILSQGLSDRTKFIRIIWRNVHSECIFENGLSTLDKELLFIGISLSSLDKAFRIVDIGPDAEKKEEALKFRKFWGDKAELRRFKDGKIAESTVWESKQWMKHLILNRIIEYVLARHLSIMKENIVQIAHQLDFSLLSDVRDPMSSSASLLETFEELSKRLRFIEDTPLKVSSVQPLDAAFRFTRVFPPEPHALASEQVNIKRLHKLPCCVQPLEIMIQLEGSGNWPMDDLAIQKTKSAFLLNIGESLQKRWGMTCIATEDDVDVLLSGYAFRLKILHQTGLSLVKTEIGSEPVKKRVSSSDKKLFLRGQHASMINGLQGLFPIYGSVVRLAKRWIASHLFSACLSEETIELLVAHLFLKPLPFIAPCSCVSGFLRFLRLLADYDWNLSPLILDINNDLSAADKKEIGDNFMLSRKDAEKTPQNISPAMFLATSYDKASEAWTIDSPSSVELRRLVAYARSSANLLTELILKETESFRWESLFRTPLNNYDAVIFLHGDRLSYPQHLLFMSKPDQGRLVAQGSGSKAFCPVLAGDLRGKSDELKNKLLVDFDPLRFYVADLQRDFKTMKFWYDSLGGDAVIGVTLERSSPKKQEQEETYEEGEDPINLLKAVAEVGKGFVKSVYYVKAPKLTNMKLKTEEVRNEKNKLAKKKKRRRESVHENSEEKDKEEVYHISSGDEDASKGMKKWLAEYHQSRPGLKVLQQRIDEFIIAHEEKLEQERKEREARAAEEGWTVVKQHKGRKKTTDSETGITVGSVNPAAVQDKLAKKKNKDVNLDFYRFQKRDRNRNEVLALQSKFEQDKKRIQQLRAARKFRPY